MPTTQEAIEALEAWHEVYDHALENGKDEPAAVETADEVLRVAGPHPTGILALGDILSDYYLPPATLPNVTVRH